MNNGTGRPLPRNRRELFIETFRTEWYRIIVLSLSISIFFIPFITSYMLKAVHTSSYMSQIPTGVPLDVARSYIVQLLYIEMMWMGIIALTLILCFTGLCMGMNYLKHLVFEDIGTKFKDNFFKTFKKSLRDGVVLGLFNGVIFFLLRVGVYLFVIFGFDTTGLVGAILSAVVYILVFGFDIFVLCMHPFYKLSIKEMFKNGFLLYFSSFFKNILFELLTFGLFIAAMVFGQILFVEIVFMVYVGIGLSLALLVNLIYTQIIFDEYINRNHAPHLMNNHIYPLGVNHKQEK